MYFYVKKTIYFEYMLITLKLLHYENFISIINDFVIGNFMCANNSGFQYEI